ncbi:MAG: NnrS family protein [Pseudomonadota bacterium]
MPRLWSTLTAAPHRATFLPGALISVLAVAWWLADMESRRHGGGGLAPNALPGPLLHGWLMLYGLFPFFIFGFLFTAMPNWLNGSKIARPSYAATALLMATGTLLVFLSPPLGLALHLAGWATGLAALLRTLVTAAPQDKRHAGIACAALGLGWLGDAALLAWLFGDLPDLLPWSTALGVWGFLTPLFLAVCHRMVPWFTSRVVPNYVVIRPYGALWAMLAACLAHAGLTATGHADLTWLAALPLAAIALWFSSRWGIARSFKVRLLAMLHIAFVWAGIAFLLFAADSLARFTGLAWSAGLAPLHALGIGFFSTMLVGMASRVSLGHSGRPLEADRATWWLFWLVQLAALTRMLPDLLPLPDALFTVAGIVWLLAFGAWAWKFAPTYWRPRIDGRPG